MYLRKNLTQDRLEIGMQWKISEGNNWSIIEAKLFLPSEPSNILIISRDIRTKHLVLRSRAISFVFKVRVVREYIQTIPRRKIRSWGDYIRTEKLAKELQVGDEFRYEWNKRGRWAVISSIEKNSGKVYVNAIPCRIEFKGTRFMTKRYRQTTTLKIRKLKSQSCS